VEKHKLYLLSLSFLLLLTVVVLSALNESRLEVFISLFTVDYFAVTAIFRPRRKWFDVVGASLFLVFCYIVFQKVMAIIS
jgi:hypothetical protein